MAEALIQTEELIKLAKEDGFRVQVGKYCLRRANIL